MIVDEVSKLNKEEKDAINSIKSSFSEKRNELERKYSSCIHKQGNVEYMPEEYTAPRYETAWQGVDCYPKLVGFDNKTKDRWARQCQKCGKVEYTYKKNKPVPEYEFQEINYDSIQI